MGNPDPSIAYRDDLSRLQRLGMAFDEHLHQQDALFCGNIGETDQSHMPNGLPIDKLTEVGVEGDQYPVFGFGAFEQGFIARIGTERARFKNVMPPIKQPSRESFAGAPINEKPHDSATVTADRVSLAMTACA